MKQLLGIALILAVGFVVSHRWFGKAKVWGSQRFFYLTGEEFLLLGLILGPAASNLIDAQTLGSLEPFIGLGLGYVGFVFGMQFRYQDLRNVPGGYYGATLAQTIACAVVVAVPLYLAFLPATAKGAFPVAAVLAITASAVGTSTSFLFLVDRRTKLGRTEVFRFMRFSSVFDDLLGVMLFAVALCALRSTGPGVEAGGQAVAWLGVSLAVGGLSGGLLLLTDRMGLGEKEELLFVLGIVLFSGGLAAHLLLSPIFTNLVGAILFCNLGKESEKYHDLLLQLEKPIYLIMLVLAGAMWAVRIEGVWIVMGAYVILRTAGKYLGGKVAGWLLGGRPGASAEFGLGLTAQSEMAVAMMVNLLLLRQDELTRLLVSAVFFAILLNDIGSSAYFTLRYRRS